MLGGRLVWRVPSGRLAFLEIERSGQWRVVLIVGLSATESPCGRVLRVAEQN